jgi:hypothetical protein
MRRRVAAALMVLLLFGCTREESSPTPAPNVLSPAPRPTVKTLPEHECFVGTIAADRATGEELLDVLDPYVPTWLPDGFGLHIGWKPPGFGDSAGAIWTDQQCRQVRLEIFPNGAHKESPQPDGRWVLLDRETCKFPLIGDVPCLTYHAQANGDAVSLLTVGLSDSDAGRVVAGISVAG